MPQNFTDRPTEGKKETRTALTCNRSIKRGKGGKKKNGSGNYNFCIL